MEAHASTYSASELGALTIQQSHVRPGRGKEGIERAHVSRLHMLEQKSRGEKWDGEVGGVVG